MRQKNRASGMVMREAFHCSMARNAESDSLIADIYNTKHLLIEGVTVSFLTTDVAYHTLSAANNEAAKPTAAMATAYFYP
jgi:hypothetical protein